MYNLHREIARFLFPRLNCRRFLYDESYRAGVYSLVAEGVGGFVLFDGTVADCAGTVAALRTAERERPAAGLGGYSERPLLFAADCEHGLTMRFEGATEFPSAWALGSAAEPALTRQVARAIAREMLAAGLDWNFAPVLDANTNPANPIINLRAFGEIPERVAEHGIAYMQGLADEGVISCGKHFPGHGDTAVDSHIGLPVLPFGMARLNETELVPFRQAIEAGIPAIMSAHLALPALDPSGDPASLSQPILAGLLRGDLGFRGVIVTDALDMGAIVERHGAGEGAVRAFLAGNDVLEIPDDPFAALQGLHQAVDAGRISAQRIEESSRRLDALLEWRAQRREGECVPERSGALAGKWREEHQALALKAARAALKVSTSTATAAVTISPTVAIHATPATITPGAAAVCLIVRDDTARGAAGHLRELFAESCPATAFTVFEVETTAPAGERNRIAEELAAALAERSDAGGTGNVAGSSDGAMVATDSEHSHLQPPLLILALMVRPRGGAGSVGLGEENDRLMTIIRQAAPVLMNFGNPYLLRDLDFPLRIDAFSSSAPSLRAALDVLL